jgi:hypothetical protein
MLHIARKLLVAKSDDPLQALFKFSNRNADGKEDLLTVDRARYRSRGTEVPTITIML